MLTLVIILFVSVTSQIDYGHDCTPSNEYEFKENTVTRPEFIKFALALFQEYYQFNNKNEDDGCKGNKPFKTLINNYKRFKRGPDKDIKAPACEAWQLKWSLNPPEVWAIQQYTLDNNNFCRECRKTWRKENNCQDTPKYFAYLMFTATHKDAQNELWKNKDLILYTGMRHIQMPKSAKIGDKITLDENQKFWGPLSSTYNREEAKKFATPGSYEGGHGIVLMITIPAGINNKEYGNFGALDISGCTGDGDWYLSIHVGEDEVILYDLPATWVTHYQTIYIKPDEEYPIWSHHPTNIRWYFPL